MTRYDQQSTVDKNVDINRLAPLPVATGTLERRNHG